MVPIKALVYQIYMFQRACFGGPQLVFSTGWTDASESTTVALDVLCSRELVWVDQWTSSTPVEPMPLRSMHRCNDASLDTVSETPTATNWTQRDRLNRRLKNWHPSVLPVLTVFLQWTSNGYVTLSTLYKGTPWLIWSDFDTLNTWGHPWEEEQVLWAKERRSSTLFVLQPWRIHPLQA